MSLINTAINSSILEFLKNRSNEESRLIVPCLTRHLGYELHRDLSSLLIEGGIPVYLVIDPLVDDPNEELKWITAEGITTKRKGNMVVLVQPGMYSYLPESLLRASSLSFDDEWPWSSGKCDSFFNFKNAIVKKILNATNIKNDSEISFFHNLISTQLIASLAEIPDRNEVLFEEIIDTVLPKALENSDYISNFLFRIGVPKNSISSVDYTVKKDTISIINKISKIFLDSSRSQLLESIEISDKSELIDKLYDNYVAKSDSYKGILALRPILGSLGYEDWNRASLTELVGLFDLGIKDDIEVNLIVNAKNTSDKDFCLLSKDKSTLIVDQNTYLDFDISVFNKSQSNSSDRNYLIELKCGNKIIYEKSIISENSLNFSDSIQFNVSDEELFGSKNTGKPKKISATLKEDNRKVTNSKPLSLFMTDDLYTTYFVVREGFKVIPLLDIKNQDAVHEVQLNSPTELIIFSTLNMPEYSIFVEDKKILSTKRSNPNSHIYRFPEILDPAEVPTGRISVHFGLSPTEYIDVELYSNITKKGHYSVEDAFKYSFRRQSKEFEDLYGIFSGGNSDPYSSLGAIEENSEIRIYLSRLFEQTNPNSSFPILINSNTLLENIILLTNGVRTLGKFNASFNESLEKKLTDRSIELIAKYQNKKNDLVVYFDSHFGENQINVRNPLYASTPTFIASEEENIEALISEYLKSFEEIIDLLESKTMPLFDQFILSLLDCVAVYMDPTSDMGLLDHSFIVISPWHPIQIYNRFRRQRAIFKSAEFQNSNEISLHEWAGSLDKIRGLTSFFGVSTQNVFFHSYVLKTSDVDWGVALKLNPTSSIKKIVSSVRALLDIKIDYLENTSASQISKFISKFLQANPSERRLEIYIRDGFNPHDVISVISKLLANNINDISNQLTGGIHIYFQNIGDLSFDEEVVFDGICVYSAPDEAKCLAANHIDILMLAPQTDLNLETVQPHNFVVVPSGEGLSSVIEIPFPALSEGLTSKISRIQETNYLKTSSKFESESIYSQCLSKFTSIVDGNGIEMHTDIKLPDSISASWVVMPGGRFDPAVLSSIVNNSNLDSSQKVLWDYNADLTQPDSEFFIISEVADGFDIALSNSDFSRIDKTELIKDLGRIGIAIGGEALRNGSNALGVLGQAGAVWMFSADAVDSPLVNDRENAGLIIPVDCFDTVLGSSSAASGISKKRSDLLVLQLRIDVSEQKLEIFCVSVEAKFSSSKYASPTSAISQAQETLDRLHVIMENAREEGGIIERFILCNLIKYGLQLRYESDEFEDRNRAILNFIANGNIEIGRPKYSKILCSTDADAISSTYDDATLNQLRISLSPKEWPSIDETSSGLIRIRNILKPLFSQPVGPEESSKSFVGSPNIFTPEVDRPAEIDANESEVQAETDAAKGEISSKNSLSKISEQDLLENYNDILRIFRNQNIEASKPDNIPDVYVEGPNSVIYTIRPGEQSNPKVYESQTIKDRLHLKFQLEEGESVRIYKSKGNFFYDIPKAKSDRYSVQLSSLWKNWKKSDNSFAVPFAIDQQSNVVSFDFSGSTTPHLLIAGTTGSGKSWAIRALLEGLVKFYSPSEVGLILIDPKLVAFTKYDNSPHLLYPTAFEISEAKERLQICWNEMEDRYRKFKELGSQTGKNIVDLESYNKHVDASQRLSRWIVAIDEYFDLIGDPAAKKEVEPIIVKIAAKSRASGIHLIIATQYPTVDVINNVLRAQLPAQLGLRVLKGQQSQVIIDQNGAESLAGNGDGLFKTGMAPVRVQCADLAELD